VVVPGKYKSCGSPHWASVVDRIEALPLDGTHPLLEFFGSFGREGIAGPALREGGIVKTSGPLQIRSYVLQNIDAYQLLTPAERWAASK